MQIYLISLVTFPNNRSFGMGMTIGVREGILLGGRKKFALNITICPKNRQLALKLTF